MKIVILTKNIVLTKELQDWIEKKLNQLERFSKLFQKEIYYNSFFGKGKPRVEMWLEIGKTNPSKRKGPIFRAEAQVRFPKKSIRAEAITDDLKKSINKVKELLEREFKKYKERAQALYKRGARKVKKELKISPGARFYRKGRIREE